MIKINPKLIIFDMDGTMLDTEPLSQEGMHVAAREQGFEVPDGFFEQMVGRNKANAHRLILETIGPGFDFERGMNTHQAYIDNYFETHGAPLKKGLMELLARLEEAGIRKCVATSTDKASAIRKLKYADIFHRFEVIFGGDDVVESKPNPEIFLKAAAFFNTDPQDCLIIEDSPAGCMGAFNAGIPFILVPDFVAVSDDVRGKALFVCRDLNEVCHIVMRGFVNRSS